MIINEYWTDDYIKEVEAFNDGCGPPPRCQASWDYKKLVAHTGGKGWGLSATIIEVMEITEYSANPLAVSKEYKVHNWGED